MNYSWFIGWSLGTFVTIFKWLMMLLNILGSSCKYLKFYSRVVNISWIFQWGHKNLLGGAGVCWICILIFKFGGIGGGHKNCSRMHYPITCIIWSFWFLTFCLQQFLGFRLQANYWGGGGGGCWICIFIFKFGGIGGGHKNCSRMRYPITCIIWSFWFLTFCLQQFLGFRLQANLKVN